MIEYAIFQLPLAHRKLPIESQGKGLAKNPSAKQRATGNWQLAMFLR
jgi:hypothetical protein